MNAVFRFVFSFGYERRRAVALAIWLLRQVRDAELDTLERYSDLLDTFDFGRSEALSLDYRTAEDSCLACECNLGCLDSVIEDLEVLDYI